MMLGRIVGAAAGGSFVLIQCLTLAHAQVLPVLQLTKSAMSGVETPIAQASGWDAVTCATRQHTVNITRPPAHGMISVVDEVTTIPASTPRFGSTGKCAGKPLTDKKILYRSNPRYKGTDTFSYESVDPNGTRGPFDVTISVTAANDVGSAGPAPAAASAATYRMLIQSHHDVGGKCLDVPFGQFARGMRVQMWECNNGSGQTFSYDETSQQLTIGNLCVESWGRGDPMDAVGLGSCNGGAKQQWKVVASKDYYQIVGVNGLCLGVRYAMKDNGAPLHIFTCGAENLAQLWALLEAPPADALGHVWDETDPGGWKAVWTRRGDTNVFDAAFTHPDGRIVTTVNSVTINGNSINVKRTESSDGILCKYTGVLVGASVSGIYECIGHSPGRWQVTIR